MINTVEYVRETCKKQGIAISQLEQELGFANGYLNPKKLKKIPYDRAVLIADKLGLSVNLLVTGEEQEKPAPSGDELDKELIEIWNTADRDERRDLLDMARMLKNRRK